MKIQPHNIDAEQSILSRMMLNSDIIPLVIDTLSINDFYNTDNKNLFRALCDIKTHIDTPSIVQWLKDNKCTVKTELLSDIAFKAGSSLGWHRDVEILVDLSRRRELIKACYESQDIAYTNLETALCTISQKIKDIMSEKQIELTNEELIQQSYKVIEQRHDKKDFFCGIKTGFIEIDEKVQGLEPKTTWYVGGLRSTGKSAFAINVCENILSENDGIIPYFSLESTHQALTFRRVARETGIHLTRIKTGNIYDNEWLDINTAYKKLIDRKLIFHDQFRYRYLENIMSRCEVLNIDNTILMIVIDFLQLINMQKSFAGKTDRFSEISDQLNWFAKEMNCPIMILSQLNADEQLKESRDIENNADNIWILSKPDEMSKDIKLQCVKGKDTGTFMTKLNFDGSTMRYRDGI